MRFRAEQEVSQRMLEDTDINDEYLFRELARKMVSEIPIKELHKLIKLTKTDPRSKESKEVFYGFNELEKDKIVNLDQRGTVLYEGECDIEGSLAVFAVWLFSNPYNGYDNAHDKVKQFLEQTK